MRPPVAAAISMDTPEEITPIETGQLGGTPGSPEAEEVEPLVGASIGKYGIVRKLGEGGMGAVFEAVHSEIGQRAAVKVLHLHLSREPKFVKRFVDEARMISMVGHPGLVKIFDFTQTSDGAQCIVMEFLEGESLWSRFSRCKGAGETPGLPVREVVRIARQVASALATVHTRGIIHRDLKPDNIMLVKDPETTSGERAKILDFGIAKLEQREGEVRSTTAGVVLGTPTYMAPEQIENTLAPSDRIDVYALGVILFELLSGAPPFRSETTAGVLRQHLIKNPPPLPPHVPAELQTLVRATLAKEPGERPSMQQVVTQLDTLGDRSKMSSDGLAVFSTAAGQAQPQDGATVLPIRATPARPQKGLLIAGGLALVTAVLVAWLAFAPRKPPVPPPAAPVLSTVQINPSPPPPAEPKVEKPLPPAETKTVAAPAHEPKRPTRKKPTPKGQTKPGAGKKFMFDDLTKSRPIDP